MSRHTASVDGKIGQQLRTLRKRQGYSQLALVRLVRERGLPHWFGTTVTRIEGGERALLLAEAMVLTQVLKCTLTDLLPYESEVSRDEALDALQTEVRDLRAKVAAVQKAVW